MATSAGGHRDVIGTSAGESGRQREIALSDAPRVAFVATDGGDRERLRLEVCRLDAGIDLPGYARAGDAGLDLRAAVAVELDAGGGRALVPTGLAVAIPEGYAGFVQPRSGLAAEHGVTCLNTPGLIDAGYRGEIKVLLVNTDPDTPVLIERGQRIAQLVVQAVEHCELVEVDRLPASERGAGGFGHTGR